MVEASRNLCSFFAGIGGFDLAFDRYGIRTVFQCEINDFCNSVLKHHWPAVKKFKDIKTLDSKDIPNAEIWCGGFPCQDVSVARGSHERIGLKGKNSGLFFPFLDLIKIRKPQILVLENVVGLLNSHNGQDFRIILRQLTEAGYSVAWRIMNSRYFGAPQSRPRVFVCAALNNPELPLRALYEKNAGTHPVSRRQNFLIPDICQKSGAIVPRVAYCLAATSGRHTGTDWSRTYVSYKKAVRRLTPSECEGLQGFPRGWTDIPVPEGSNPNDCDAARYHALGNAVAVPVVEWIAQNIMNAETRQSRLCNGLCLEDITKPYEDFPHSNTAMTLNEPDSTIKPNSHALRWKSGGFAGKNRCLHIRAPEAPRDVIEKPLIEVIEKKAPAKHYYLSPNAAQGILRRVDGQNRTLFRPMDRALREMVRHSKPL